MLRNGIHESYNFNKDLTAPIGDELKTSWRQDFTSIKEQIKIWSKTTSESLKSTSESLLSTY